MGVNTKVQDTDDDTDDPGDEGTSTQTPDVSGLKSALQKERERARQAENREKALRLEIAKHKSDGDTSKTDMEKLNEKLATLEKRAEEAERKALKAEVAAEFKLTPRQAARLSGSTREELISDAEDMIEDFGLKAEGTKPSTGSGGTDAGTARRRPTENLQSGSDGGGEKPVTSKDAGEIAERALGSALFG